MEAFLVSLVVVAAGEMGDKTQLLALLLATRYHRRVPIALGILVATLANHTLAGLVGAWLRNLVPAEWLRWIVAASFFAMALWSLKPDRLEARSDEAGGAIRVFAITTGAFFMVEMGDKTQIAMVADVPVVWFGRAIAAKISLQAARLVAAALFAALALVAIFAG